MSGYISKEKASELSKKDYLNLEEVSKRIVSQIRPDLLYRTHVAMHTLAKQDISKKVVLSHKIIADELKLRGFMHHQWDKLDTIYNN